jgi:tRNA dimethylallyltransferase
MMGTTRRTVAIMGATATGKSDLAIRVAMRFGAEIISMDSRQVYRGLDIGTGKVSAEERRLVAHHLIDTLDPQDANSAGAHVDLARGLCDAISSRGNAVFFVGGTGLYFRILFRGIIDAATPSEEKARVRRELAAYTTEELHRRLAHVDPDRAKALSPRDRVRIVRALEIALITGRTYTEHVTAQARPSPWRWLKVVLTLPRALLRERIAERTREMYERGWTDEVGALIARGIGLDAPAMRSLGYDVIARSIVTGGDPRATLEKVITITRQYAKRQETFFRGESDALWFDVSRTGAFDEIERRVGEHLGL